MIKKGIGYLSVFAIIYVIFATKSIETNQTQQTVETTDQGKTQDINKTNTDTVKEIPKASSSSDWNLVLVNKTHPIQSEDFPMKDLDSGYTVDERIQESYYEMISAAREAGIQLIVISAYRSVSYQQELYNEDLQKFLDQGLSQEEAKEKTEEYMIAPGYSEHHTGLALDLVSQEWLSSGKSLTPEFASDPAAIWLAKNGPLYGFIIRYPEGKEKMTGINYEPWHIRYVGKENAEYMQKNKLTLEEYLSQLEKAGK